MFVLTDLNGTKLRAAPWRDVASDLGLRGNKQPPAPHFPITHGDVKAYRLRYADDPHDPATQTLTVSSEGPEGGEWVVRRVATDRPLADVQAEVLSRIAAHRWQIETAGAFYGETVIPTDDRSKTLILGARTKALEDPTYTKKWKVAPGEYVLLDAATLVAMGDAVLAHVDEAFAAEEHHATAVLTLTTVADVVAYDYTTGWPANPAAVEGA